MKIDKCLFSCYSKAMNITQTIEIPANRRVHLDIEIPPEIPIGKAKISITPLVEPTETPISFLSFRGSREGLDTMDAYFERKRAEKEREDRKYRRETGND